MDLRGAIDSRRSVREAALHEPIHAAVQAPSALNEIRWLAG